MSDTVSKWYDMQDELSSKGIAKLENKVVSEGHKKQAYNILIEYPEEAILEAARIIKGH